jgi:hypothetical protein
MGLPVSELIALNILATVEGVQESSGYNYNITAQRHSRSGDKESHLNAIIVQEDAREVTEPKVYNTKEWIQPYNIGVFIMPPEDDPTPIDTYVNLIIADVQKALMVDRYRDQNALDTQVRAAHIVSEKGLEYEIAVVVVEVTYRINELDPYQRA